MSWTPRWLISWKAPWGATLRCVVEHVILYMAHTAPRGGLLLRRVVGHGALLRGVFRVRVHMAWHMTWHMARATGSRTL